MAGEFACSPSVSDKALRVNALCRCGRGWGGAGNGMCSAAGLRSGGRAPPGAPIGPNPGQGHAGQARPAPSPGIALIDVTTPVPSADALLIRANKLELLERLADDLAHEIKNPLHSMVINLEVLKRRLARAGEPEEVLRYIGVLGGELERVNRRIELLLRLSRPGRGSEATTLNEQVDELMELLQLEARHHRATVEYDPGNRMTRVRTVRATARQVILNLVLEVLDGMDEGGVLRLALSEADGRARLAVIAPGVALSEAPLDGDPASRYSVARALAEAIGGAVEAVEGADGTGGAVFSLPADRA
jgi:hypothetical protein